MPRPKLYRADQVLDPDGRPHRGGGILVADGRIVRLLRTPAACKRAAREAAVVALESGVLAPGLVNAHAHLDLTGLAGKVPSGRRFRGWVDQLIALRTRASEPELVRARQAGADRLLATGTVAVGDIESGVAPDALAVHAIRLRLFREVLDGGDPARVHAAMERVRRALPRRRGMAEGLSPHAPYSVSAKLFTRLAVVAERRGLPVTIHWSETAAELRWMREGKGEFAGLCARHPDPAGRFTSGLDRIEAAGMLGPRTSLVHGNFPQRGELPRIARAGATVVHCPGSHAFFRREPFPLQRYRRAGVPVALGTDSAASNDDLDMRREMALLRRAHPGVTPAEVWRMATYEGARALGFEDEIGSLSPGHSADFCHFETESEEPRDVLEELTTACPPVRGTWIRGVPAGSAGARPKRKG